MNGIVKTTEPSIQVSHVKRFLTEEGDKTGSNNLSKKKIWKKVEKKAWESIIKSVKYRNMEGEQAGGESTYTRKFLKAGRQPGKETKSLRKIFKWGKAKRRSRKSHLS